MKARAAQFFLPPGVCRRCDVIAEGPSFIMREGVIMNEEITDLVLGQYSVHSSPATLRAVEQRPSEIQQRLQSEGRLA